ncbi:MAG: hypothetical protein KAW12_29600 [Candidatus Aminicenantes bacterium]|nr:hypothetical protein [Candidatus Aminicenantes bacterium]
MNFNAIIKRVKNMVFKTGEEWDNIRGESTSIQDLYLKFGIIVYAVPAAAFFIGMLIAFRGRLFGRVLFMAILFYAFTMGVIFLMGLLADVIGKQFGAPKDMSASQKLCVYSLTPYAVIGVLFLFLTIGGGISYLILAASLFSFYPMALGAGKLKDIAKDKLVPFIAIMAIAWLILIYAAYQLSGRIVFSRFF